MRDLWPLDPSVTFLNHGSYGACPNAVLAKQSALRAQLEANPMRFFQRELQPLLDDAREVLADYLSAPAEDLAFVPNATHGVNTVLASIAPGLGPADELLTTDHAYNACKNALLRVCEQTGARLVIAELPLPVPDAQSVTRAILAKTSSRTKLALIDHVTSPTAFVLPIADIVAALQDRGVDVLVDGAHAPGQVNVDLGALRPAYYTANCHKWMCAPKGAAFLYVRRDLQPRIYPLSTSHGMSADPRGTTRFRLEFDWTGTVDPTPYLCVPEAIRVLSALGELQARNRALAAQATAMLAERFSLAPSAPESMRAAMGALILEQNADDLQERLALEGIEVPVTIVARTNTRLLRLSAHAYNEPGDYERLADVLAKLQREAQARAT
jgi:isopenicillin-N epimerase